MYVNIEDNFFSTAPKLKDPIEKLCSPNEDEQWDLDVWKEFKKKNKKAYEQLYSKYYYLLYNYGIRLAKDDNIIRDCIQDLFVDLWRYSDKLIDPKSVKKYLFLSIRRRINKVLIKENKKVSNNKFNAYNFDFVPSHEHTLIGDQAVLEQNKLLVLALNHLTPKQKEALYLKYFENLTSPQIASIMSLTINSTYVLISESMKVLRTSIKRYLPSSVILLLFKIVFLIS